MKNALQKQIQVKLRPKENVEYTFLFVKNDKATGKISYSNYTLIYLCSNQKGRDLFFNKTTKSMVNYSRGWFAHMYRKQLVSEVALYKDEIKKAIEPKPEESYEERVLRVLRGATTSEEISVLAIVGRTPQAIADDLERIADDENYTQEYINRVCAEMMKAYEILTGMYKPNKKLFNVL